MVETQHNSKLKILRTDNGSEYTNAEFQSYYSIHGILHQSSCPHAPEQNGVLERKHRHVVETGLALLYHASVPLCFWDDAFQTACYLINHLPTPILQNQSPFTKLFKISPDYSLLKFFGSTCWPNLRPYNSNKLQPRSLQCVFLGYSLRHRGYKCFHVSTNRLYISRDVIFQENSFPFSLPTTSSTHGSPASILGPYPGLLQPMHA